MLSLLATALLVTQSGVYQDGRDDRTLLPQKLINRNLPSQVTDWRLGGGLGPFTVASDVQIGSQAPLDGGDPTPFHGFFTADAYLAFRVFEGLDVNLNVLMLNTTASGGFRVLSDILPGLNAHLTLELGDIESKPVVFDFVTPDLDIVTLGEGLLVETIPLEGFRGGLAWNGLELQVVFGGRVFWQQDDLLHFSFSAFDGGLGASYTYWFSGFFREDDLFPPAQGHLASVYGRWSPLEGVTLAGEFGARLAAPDRPISTAALARADLVRRLEDFSVHLGYQFRWYQTGYGPLDELSTPSTLPSVPIREDYYVTNSFEFLWVSPFFDQWSHSVMLEANYDIDPVQIFVEVEWWLRIVSDREADSPRLVGTPQGDLLPGVINKAFYRIGLKAFPFEGLPHNVAAFISNKSVFSFGRATNPVPIRFIERPIFFVEAEVKL